MTLDKLGQAIAQSQDPTLAAQVDAARARFDQAAPAARRGRAWIPVIALAAAIALVFGVRARRAPEPLTFEIGARIGSAGEPIEAPPAEELQLRFSDHTTVLLSSATHGVVDDVTARGARVRLHRGGAAVSVPPGHGAAWTFDVGPFEVAVAGTRFDVSWDDAHQVFLLVMHDGSVKVRGPTIADQRVVVAGETLRVPLGLEIATVELPPPDAAPSSVVVAPEDHGDPVVAEPVSPARAKLPVVRPPTWQELAASGDFRAALAGVRDHFDGACATASSSDVTMLGDIARYAGDLSRAQQAYLAARRRFPGPESAAATFALARMAFEAPDDAEAIRWLTTYRRENPDGALAREALGRLLELYVRTHDDAAVRRTATLYLDTYPSGPHAKLAHSVLPP